MNPSTEQTAPVAIVTGARIGIGRAVAERLSSEGFRVAMFSRVIDEHQDESRLCLRCDVTDPGSVAQAVEAVESEYGRIDVLVNCAGRSHLGLLDEVQLRDMRDLFDANVLGTLSMMKAVVPYMRRQGSGYVINIGSIRGMQGARGKAAYCSSKFAVRGLSLTLAVELAEEGVRVTVINPGYVETALIHRRIEEEHLKSEDLTQPEDIARAVMFLLSLSPGAQVDELTIGRIW